MSHTLDQQTIEEMKEVLLRRLPERMDIGMRRDGRAAT